MVFDNQKHDRRSFLKVASSAGVAGMAGLAGCTGGGNGGDGGDGGGGGATPTPTPQDQQGTPTPTSKPTPSEPFKLGILEPLSGPISPTGKTALEGMRFLVDDINNRGGLNGRQIEILTADTQAVPDTAIKRARQLVTQENVDMLAGVTSSAVAKAVNKFASQQGIVFVDVNAQTPDITGKECSKTTFRTSTNIIHLQKALSRGVAKLTPDDATKIAGVNPDYVYGHQSWKIFLEELKKLRSGIEVVSETFPAFQKGDYKKEIQATLGADADIVHSVLYAGDMISFMKQAKQFDFFQQVPHFAYVETMSVLYSLGNNFPDGHLIGEQFVAGPAYPDTEAHNQFTQAFIDEHGKEPTSNAYAGAGFMRALEEAVKKAGGTSTDALVSGFEGLKFESPQSPETLVRAGDHQGLLKTQLVDEIEPLDDKDRYGFKKPFNTVPRSQFKDTDDCQF